MQILGVHPSDLFVALDRYFENTNWLEWEPEVLLHELKDDITEREADKVLAVKSVAVNTNLVYTNACAFENVCHAFCNNIIVVDTLQPLYIEEIMYAIPHIIKITKEIHGNNVSVNFTGEIPGYVAATAKYRGWYVLPTRLAFAQELLEELTGVQEGTAKYNQFAVALNEAKQIAEAIETADIYTYKDVIDSAPDIVKTILGAYLYDPTKIYGSTGNTP